ncbi:DsbA family protein [Myxococcota bacterium]|nr:DsbA family protein [Myxococcota bacterium]
MSPRGRIAALLLGAVVVAGAAFGGGWWLGQERGLAQGVAEGRRAERRARGEKVCVTPSAWDAALLKERAGGGPDLSPEHEAVWVAAVNTAESPCPDERSAGISLGECLVAGGTCGSCVLQAEAAARLAGRGLSLVEVKKRLSQEVWQELDLAGAPADGPDDAPVVLTEWSDFQCPYCREASEVLKELRRRFPDDLQVVWMDRPLTRIHPQADPAAEAARAASLQGRFWPFHDLLFARQKELRDLAGEEVPFQSLAREAGLDLDRYRRDLADPATEAAVRAATAQAQALAVSGTPTFYLGNLRWRGPRTVEALAQGIETAKAEGTGVPRKVGPREPPPAAAPAPSPSAEALPPSPGG